MNHGRRLFLRLAPLLAFGTAAGTARADDAAWRVLAAGGCALLMRHASTVPGIGDPPGFRLDDCATQRNLADGGRAEARRFGAEMERRGIVMDAVLSSRWCRCLETARLAFPRNEVGVLEALNSFFADASARAAQTEALRGFLARQRPPRRLALVTHMVNIAALTGESVAMGEALLLRLGPEGTGAVLGRLRA